MKSNIDLDQLKRNKNSSPESKLEWLYSALVFAQTPKKIIKKESSSHRNR